VLQQVAHAVFDLLKVPVWGSTEDAADRVAALIMMKFGDQVAYTTMIGTAKFFEYSKHAWTGADFAEAESPEAQRFYNFLCIAYGGDPITFHFLAPRPGPSAFPRLPEHRAARCSREYRQVQHAFDLRIMPYVDPDLLIKVRASQWLLPDEIPKSVK
jgi:Putative metallopeptidase